MVCVLMFGCLVVRNLSNVVCVVGSRCGLFLWGIVHGVGNAMLMRGGACAAELRLMVVFGGFWVWGAELCWGVVRGVNFLFVLFRLFCMWFERRLYLCFCVRCCCLGVILWHLFMAVCMLSSDCVVSIVCSNVGLLGMIGLVGISDCCFICFWGFRRLGGLDSELSVISRALPPAL